MPLPISAPTRTGSTRRPARGNNNNTTGSFGTPGGPGSYPSSPNVLGGGFGSPRTTSTGAAGSPLPGSRLLTPRAVTLGGSGAPGRATGGGGVGAVRIPLGSHQQLQQALLVGGIAGAGEAVKVRGSPSPAEGLRLGSGGMRLGEDSGSSGGGSSGSGSNVKKLDKDKDEETGDEGDDDGYDEDEEGGDDDDGEVEDENEVMSEIQTGLLVRRTESRSKGGLSSGSGFFGSMEMDCDEEKTDEDPEPDLETEEAPTTDTGEMGDSTTDDGATRETSVAPAAKPATATGVWKKAPPPPLAPPAGKVARSSTRESDREKDRKDKEARDKIKMPPPPPMVKRAASTATKGAVRPAMKEGTTTSSRARAISNATSSHTTTTGLSRATSVRKGMGMVTKEDGGAITTAGVKPRNAADSKTQTKPGSSTTPPTTTAASTATTRQMRTRSIAGGTAPTQTSSTSRQNGATTGTDSEDLIAANRRTGLVKRPRPQSMFLPPGTKSGTEKESDSGAPPSPTAAGPTSSRPRQPPVSSKDSRKPSTRTPAASGASTQTTTTTISSHRRNPSEAQPTIRPPRPEFTTLQKDYSTPTPIPKPAETTSTTTLLPDAPTLQKQTHLLQLLLLHNTAIESFQSLHSSAHTILSARYQATVDLYNHVRTRLLSDARAADLAVLRKIWEATPQVPPVGGVARWGTASGRRLSGSREHLATGDGRRRTLSGEMCSPVEERIQVLSESMKRVEGLLRKGGEVSRVRAGWEGWVERRKGASEEREDGLPKQWHRDWATVKRKVEVAVDGVRDFWVAYQHVLSQLALESLCRTEEVLDRSEVAVASLKASSGSVPFSAISAIKAGEFRSKTASSMSMGIILNPPLSESSNTPRTITMSPSERQYRSTILIDPTAGGMTGHRLQRSLDTRVRIFTSPNFPSKEFSDHIVWSYFRHLDPLWHVHIGWLFDDEYKEFWKLRNDGRHIEVDPAWGALLLMTLALGLQVTELPLPQHLLPHPSATSNDILALADSYICDVEELLNTSNWARSPQLRVLQTLALFSAFQSLQSLRDPTTFTMNGAGIRIAQILGLHDLGDTDNPNPLSALLNDDIAVPTGNQPLKEHLARMLWHALLVLELVHVSRAGIRIPLASTPYTTQLPINVDDTAFQVLPPSVPIAGAIKAKPPWQLTSVSSLHLRSLLSKNDKILLDLPADMKATDKYTHVMGFDAELRKWISASPTRQAAQHDYAAYKLSQWQHWSLMADVHGAIIHAHRPYMTRGYSDPRFSFSTKTCLESAKVLCESWQYLRDYITDQRFWWTSMRYLSAALVIFIDLFIAMDEGCPDEVLAQKRSDIPLICEILQERMSSVHSTTSMFAAAAFGVVSNLLEAEKAKKAAMIAKKDSTDGIAGVEVEPVGRVFKRIAQTMTSGSGIKPEGVLTGATSSNLPRTVSQDGTSTFHRSMYQSAEQAAVTQLAGAKRGKDAHRALVQAIELGRHAKTPRLSPTQGRPQTAGPDPIKTSFHGHLNSSASSPNIHLPSLASASSGSTPSFVMETDPHISQHDSFNPMPHGSFAWMPSGGSQNGQRQQSQADYTYLNDGSFGTTPQLQQTLAQGYQQQVQATPISWDTSQLFHPDPSVLLHSMGFPATPLQTSFSLAPPEHQGHNPAIVLQQEQFAPQAQSSSLSSSWYGSSAN